jgi:hypothetical protein
MRNRSRNPRFAFGKTEADHGNRGAAGSPRSVARRAFGRALASVPRGNSGSVGVPVAETEWRTENVGSRHSSGAASREKANQKSRRRGELSERETGLAQSTSRRRLSEPQAKTRRRETQREQRNERGNQDSIYSAGAGEEKTSERRKAARASVVAARIKRQNHWNPSAARKDPTGPGLGAHKKGTEPSTAREKIFKRKKSDQQVRPAIWTKIKAKNSQKKFSDLVSTRTRCKLKISH